MNDESDRVAVDPAEPRRRLPGSRVVIVLVIAAALAGLLLAKATTDRTAGGGGADQAGSITAVHNDAVADYEAALKTGKPIYVLFHSLS